MIQQCTVMYTDLVLAYIGGNHHENGTSVDEDDSHDVVERTDVVLFSIKVMVAVSLLHTKICSILIPFLGQY